MLHPWRATVSVLAAVAFRGCVDFAANVTQSSSAEGAGATTVVRESGTTRRRVTGACAATPLIEAECVGIIDYSAGRFTVDADSSESTLSVRWEDATRPDGEWEVWVADADGARWGETRTGMGAQPVTFPLRPLVAGTYTVEARPIATGVGFGPGEVGWTVRLSIAAATS